MRSGINTFWEHEGCLATVVFSSVLPEAWRGETPAPKLSARPLLSNGHLHILSSRLEYEELLP